MKKMALCSILLLLMVLAGSIFSRGQTAASGQTLPVYDVVSVKPSRASANSPSIWNNMDRYVATDISLRRLLQDAYNIREDLITGIPRPIDVARFDITAKILNPDMKLLGDLSPEQWRSMRRSMLSDSFKLKAHTSTKTLPVYELVVTKEGPKFKASDGKGDTGMTVNSHGRIEGHNVSTTRLATTLGGLLQKTVVDKTGLTSTYDFNLRWSNNVSEAEGDAGPSLFTALREQMGLKLQSAKGPVDTLVVDHVEMPPGN